MFILHSSNVNFKQVKFLSFFIAPFAFIITMLVKCILIYHVIKMADILNSSRLSLPFCDVMTLVTLLLGEQQDLERTSLIVLYSNVCSLRQAYGELCKTCSILHTTMICLTKMHLCQDATDAVCPARYVVASCCDQS